MVEENPTKLDKYKPRLLQRFHTVVFKGKLSLPEKSLVRKLQIQFYLFILLMFNTVPKNHLGLSTSICFFISADRKIEYIFTSSTPP